MAERQADLRLRADFFADAFFAAFWRAGFFVLPAPVQKLGEASGDVEEARGRRIGKRAESSSRARDWQAVGARVKVPTHGPQRERGKASAAADCKVN